MARVREKNHPVVLDGEEGVGKSAALLQIVACSLQSKWFVLYVPNAVQWIEGRYPYRMGTDVKGSFEQPTLAAEYLKMLKELNSELVNKILVKKNYVFGQSKISSGSKLSTLFDVGINHTDMATPVFRVVLAELTTSEDVPVLIAVDQLNALFSITHYKDRQSKSIPSSAFAMLNMLASFFDHTATPLINGVAIGATSKRDSFAQLKTGIDSHLSPRSHVSTLPTYSKNEASHLLHYYKELQLMYAAPSDQLLHKLYMVSAGNGRKFYRVCSRTGVY